MARPDNAWALPRSLEARRPYPDPAAPHEVAAVALILRGRQIGQSFRSIVETLNLAHPYACRGARWHLKSVHAIARRARPRKVA
jgi:hypothetical protein